MQFGKGASELKGKKIIFSEITLLYGRNRNFKESRVMSYLFTERVTIPVHVYVQSRTPVVLLSLCLTHSGVLGRFIFTQLFLHRYWESEFKSPCLSGNHSLH